MVPAEGSGDLQTLICVLVARPRRCLTWSNPVPRQNWMAAYLGYTLRMKMLFRGWPVVAHETHTRRRRRTLVCCQLLVILPSDCCACEQEFYLHTACFQICTTCMIVMKESCLCHCLVDTISEMLNVVGLLIISPVMTGQMSVCPSLRVNLLKTPRLRYHSADINETRHIYSVDLGSGDTTSRQWNFDPCATWATLVVQAT